MHHHPLLATSTYQSTSGQRISRLHRSANQLHPFRFNARRHSTPMRGNSAHSYTFRDTTRPQARSLHCKPRRQYRSIHLRPTRFRTPLVDTTPQSAPGHHSTSAQPRPKQHGSRRHCTSIQSNSRVRSSTAHSASLLEFTPNQSGSLLATHISARHHTAVRFTPCRHFCPHHHISRQISTARNTPRRHTPRRHPRPDLNTPEHVLPPFQSTPRQAISPLAATPEQITTTHFTSRRHGKTFQFRPGHISPPGQITTIRHSKPVRSASVLAFQDRTRQINPRRQSRTNHVTSFLAVTSNSAHTSSLLAAKTSRPHHRSGQPSPSLQTNTVRVSSWRHNETLHIISRRS
jgi:hypothetical protein